MIRARAGHPSGSPGNRRSTNLVRAEWGRVVAAHILIVQDDPKANKTLESLLARSGYQTTTFVDPRGVSAFLAQTVTDLIVLDIAIPSMDGFALCAALRRDSPDMPIIVLSARDSLHDKVTAFGHGADDFIRKPFEPDELLARIGAATRRYRRVAHDQRGALIQVGNASLDLGKLQFRAAARGPVLLTPTEMRLLECLMRNANTVVSRDVLIKRTRACDADHESNRADVFIRRLRRKIESNPDKPTLIRTVRGIGYIFREGRGDGEPAG